MAREIFAGRISVQALDEITEKHASFLNSVGPKWEDDGGKL
jgi:hypothetical protein